MDTFMNKFLVIGANEINEWLNQNANVIIDLVENCYLSFSKGDAICPDSYFLRFPNEPINRIIALPSSIESGDDAVAGIKWISSFPKNIENSLDRASAVLILNDRSTGYPIACLEGSLISAYRTAASAIVGAQHLHSKSKTIEHLTIIGSGLISHTTINLFKLLGWTIKKISVVDKDLNRAQLFCEKIGDSIDWSYSSKTDSIADSDMILFATSAIEPYINDPSLFTHNPTILHMSLRDISPEIVLNAQNFADDVDHAVKANTSLHLAEQKVNNRNFIDGSISELLKGIKKPDLSKTRIWSPFGMGILDISVGYKIYQDVSSDNVTVVDNFFPKPYVV